MKSQGASHARSDLIVTSESVCTGSCRSWSSVLEFHAHPPRSGRSGSAYSHWVLTRGFKTMLEQLTSQRRKEATDLRRIRDGMRAGAELDNLIKPIQRRKDKTRRFNAKYYDVFRLVNSAKSEDGLPMMLFPIGLESQRDRRMFEAFIYEVSHLALRPKPPRGPGQEMDLCRKTAESEYRRLLRANPYDSHAARCREVRKALLRDGIPASDKTLQSWLRPLKKNRRRP